MSAGRGEGEPEGTSRIPSLDGLRAISIGLVLFSHLLGTVNFLGRDVFQVTGDLGNLGVRFFFTISGFLISTLLFNELERSGEISLKRFYLRRTFRIFPAFYVCLGTIAILNAGGWVKLNPYDLVTAATYTINYRTAVERSWNVGHMWSLAVEEQFYLLWPVVIWWLARGKALGVAAIVVAIVPLLRIGTWQFFPEWLPGIKWQFHTVCDSLATGCLLAGLQTHSSRYPVIDRLIGSNLMMILPFMAALMNVFISGRPRVNFLFGQTFMNFCIALFLLHCIRHPRQWAGRILSLRPLEVIGIMSYSLYLWQQLFLNHYAKSWPYSFPTNLLLTATAACVSYILVERPCLRFRRNLEKRWFGRTA